VLSPLNRVFAYKRDAGGETGYVPVRLQVEVHEGVVVFARIIAMQPFDCSLLLARGISFYDEWHLTEAERCIL